MSAVIDVNAWVTAIYKKRWNEKFRRFCVCECQKLNTSFSQCRRVHSLLINRAFLWIKLVQVVAVDMITGES